MEDKPKIKLIFFQYIGTTNLIDYFKLSFDTIIHKIDSSEKLYDIPEDIFKFDKSKQTISIELYSSSKNLLNKINFNVHYGLNHVYIEKEGDGKALNFEMVFKSFNNLKVYNNGYEFKELDNYNTNNRKKLTILNYRFNDISINDIILHLLENIKIKSDFYQFSLNFGDNNLIVQPNEDIQKPELHILMKKKSKLNSFFKKIQGLFENSFNYKQNYFEIYKSYKDTIEIGNFRLNGTNAFLDDYFKDNNIELAVIFKYSILKLFLRGRKKYSNSLDFWKNTVDIYSAFYNDINGNELKIYEKIILLSRIGDILYYCRDIESLKKINIKYIILSKIQKDSIIDKTRIFYNDFVSNLSENSKIFNYLLNLDSGIGYYKGEITYTFDMTNLETIKMHLKELFPNILIFYYYNNRVLANTNKGKPYIAINRMHFFQKNPSYEESLDKFIKDKDINIIKDMSINLFVLLLHEAMGHNKLSYNKNLCISPAKIVKENNILIKLKKYSEYCFNKENEEYILSHNNESRGESGSYIELAYGKFGRQLITNIMLDITDKSKLLTRADLFTDKTCETLKKYIILKKVSDERKLEVKEINEKSTIEEDIKAYEKYIDYKELTEEKIEEKDEEKSNYKDKKKDEIKLIGKKTKRISDKKDDDDNSNTENCGSKKNDDVSFENKINTFEPEDSNVEEKSEDSNQSYSNVSDEDELFKLLYKKILKKYSFEDNELVLQKISEKLKDESLKSEEREDLLNVMWYLDIVY